MSENNKRDELSDLIARVSSLEIRISELESGVVSSPKAEFIHQEEAFKSKEEELTISSPFTSSILESKIGEYGLAWFGNIVLLFSGVFLHLYVQSQGQVLMAALIGYAFVAIMFLVSGKIKKSFSYLSTVFSLFAKILLFYVTVGLFFIGPIPAIPNKQIVLALLLLQVIYQVYQSIKFRSEKHSQLGLFFLIITAVLSNETHILLPLLTLAAAGSLYFMFRFGWSKTIIITLSLVYFSFFMWILGNPFVNSGINVITISQYSEYYLFTCATLFSIAFLIKEQGLFSKGSMFYLLILNGMGFSLLLTFLSLLFFKESYQSLFAFISIFCIIYSFILKKYSDWKYTPALYAVYGFVAISITFYGVFKLPLIFLTLSLQSLLVLSMALWFRSKIIVVMNTIMFIVLTIVYLASIESVDLINFSFPLVALVSARIINWQQKRLTLETQFIRNLYLFILFFSILYALQKVLPSQYITLSWSLTALLYFGLSLLLKLVKYRYLAIATLGAAAIYLIFVDLATINVVYRILAFLFLAIISIGISVFYVNKSKLNQVINEEENLE